MGTKSSGKVFTKRSFYSIAPKNITDGDLPTNFFKQAEGKEFLALERVKGISFMIVIDNENIKVHSDKKANEIVEYINGNLIRPISKLIQHFNKIDMSIYGEYITHKDSATAYIGPPSVYFYDMYINENWIKNDDFIEIFNSFGLPVAPIIRNGSMTNDYYNNLFKIVSTESFIQGFTEMYGIYLKSLNGMGEHRSITKGSYFFLNPKFKSVSKNKTEKESLQKKVEELAYFTVTEELLTKWEVLLKARGIEKNKSNLDKIMPIVISDYIKKHTEEREILAIEEDISESEAEKYMRKHVGKIIISKMF